MSSKESSKNQPSKNGNLFILRPEGELPDHKTAVHLDDLDRAIIEAQLEDPFFSFSELAETWDVSSATVRNRIKRLKATGVIDVVTVINPYKVGYDTFAIIGIKIKTEASIDKVVEKLQSIERVASIFIVAGGFDFFVTYVCHNLEEYRRFVNDELRQIPEISSFESFMGLDLYERRLLMGVVS